MSGGTHARHLVLCGRPDGEKVRVLCVETCLCPLHVSCCIHNYPLGCLCLRMSIYLLASRTMTLSNMMD